jgi:predicted nucleotidyltransferase
VYYDVLDYPLTAFEIWKYLINSRYNVESLPAGEAGIKYEEEKYSLYEIIKTLDSEELKKYIEEYRGFYFLKGRKELVEARIARSKISEVKYKIIRKIVRFLKYAPFLRMIAVTGRVAMKNAGAKSDLDLLIAIKDGRIFTGRFFVTLISQLLGKRRHGEKITGRACLKYFMTDKDLKVKLKDLFSSSEYSFIFPIYNFPVFKKFQQSNLWIRDYRSNFEPDAILNQKMVYDNFLSENIRKIMETVLDSDFLEKWMKKWQMGRIAKDPRTHQQGSAVTASDENLIFLPDPQGPRIYEKYQEKLKTLSF